MPNPAYDRLRFLYRKLHRGALGTLSAIGLNAHKTSDFYSPLPVYSELEKTRELWDQPSEMVGLTYDLERMKALLSQIVAEHGEGYLRLPSYQENKKVGYGPGFTIIDSMTLYLLMRHLKPRRYIEVGSGLSTYYSWLATEKNREDGAPCSMSVVDPYPRPTLRELSGLSISIRPVQEVEPDFFAQLDSGDVLFIDTTHVLKIGGDVAYLFLEIVPRVRPGVVIHVHDIHFPYNVPYPAEQYIFRAKWPSYFTEAMLLQAFLAFNDAFELLMSAPLLRYFDEDFLARTIPNYRPVEVSDYDTHFGSIWLQRVQ